MGLKRLSKRLPDRPDGVPHHIAAVHAARAGKARWLRQGRPQGPGPIIVGALGGSATRLVVDLMQHSGVWMGDWLDQKSHDSISFRVFIRRHFVELATAGIESGGRPVAGSQASRRTFARSLAAHTVGHPGGNQAWGWKNPRMLWLLPFLSVQVPKLRFVHVLRDGREIAQSENRFLLDREGRRFLSAPLPEDPVMAQLRLWTIGNRAAAQAARQNLAEDCYLRLRYEDLCQRPVETIRQLLAFVGAQEPAERAERLASRINPSPRLGSGQQSDAPRLDQLDEATRNALAEFGYG